MLSLYFCTHGCLETIHEHQLHPWASDTPFCKILTVIKISVQIFGEVTLNHSTKMCLVMWLCWGQWQHLLVDTNLRGMQDWYFVEKRPIHISLFVETVLLLNSLHHFWFFLFLIKFPTSFMSARNYQFCVTSFIDNSWCDSSKRFVIIPICWSHPTEVFRGCIFIPLSLRR